MHSIYIYTVTNHNKKLYVAFIDFRKYFDLINRDFLNYQLQKAGITGKV